MARTIQRRRFRAIRSKDLPSTAESDVVSSEPQDRLWQTLEDHLLGLLSVTVHSGFVSPDFEYTPGVTLTISLELVRSCGVEPRAMALGRTLEAFATLCCLFESVRQRPKDHKALWHRVLESDMMEVTWEEPQWIDKMSHRTRLQGLQVELSYGDRPLRMDVVRGMAEFVGWPRDKFFAACEVAPTVPLPRPLGVKFKFKRCQLDAKHIHLLRDLMATATESRDTQVPPLCAIGELTSLDVSHNVLDPTALHAIADLIETRTLRIDGLSLKGALPSEDKAYDSFLHKQAFRRLMNAAFTANDWDHRVHGFSLTLARNNHLQPAHMDAIRDALANATRPLTALFMNDIQSIKTPTRKLVGSLLFTPTPATTSEARVAPMFNLSGSGQIHTNLLAFRTALEGMVLDAIHRVRAALRDNVPVTCRVGRLVRIEVPEPPEPPQPDVEPTEAEHQETKATTPEYLHPNVEYRVLHADRIHESRGRFEVVIPTPEGNDGVAPLTMLLEASDISCLKIDSEDVVRMQFPRLVLNEPEGEKDRVDTAMIAFMGVVGPDVEQLTMCNHRAYLLTMAEVLRWTCNLRQLNLYHSTVTNSGSIWKALPSPVLRRLEVLRLCGSYMSSNSLSELHTLIQSDPNAFECLRCLSVTNTYFCPQALEAFCDVLGRRHRLEWVDIDRGSGSACDKIDKLLLDECVPMDVKVAFVNVLARRSQLDGLERGIVGHIFQFTGRRQPRGLVWWNRT